MTEPSLFILGLALALLSGVRVYLTVFGVGLAGLMGWVDLPSSMQVAQSPWVVGACGVMALVEFSADKIPGVDSGWDLLHTLLRVPVGAFLATSAVGGIDSEYGMGALAAGGTAALLSHGMKTGSRALINASPEPVTNWTASATEDVATLGALGLLFTHPEWAAVVVAVFACVILAVFYLFYRLVTSVRKPKEAT